MSYSGLLFLILSIAPSFLQFTFSTAQTHVYEFCDLGGYYTANSTFQTNLNLLLSSISDSSSLNSSKFLSKTAGRDPDAAYGLFQCRGDQSSESCKKCADTAAKSITIRCPYRKESVIYYDECLIHYSDKSFVSTMQWNPTYYVFSTANVSEADLFTYKLAEVMRGLVAQAIANPSRLYAVGKDNFISVQSIYGLVQCTQDLSTTDCYRCLSKAISEFTACCDGKQGGQVIKPSCISRYEIYDFLEPGAIVTPPPPPSPPKTNSATVPTVLALVLLLIGMVFFCLRKEKSFEIAKIDSVDEISHAESLQVNFSTVGAATNNFDETNKLGQGGFGTVYKGTLSDGQEIAVKRLTRNSGQGDKEFKNEVLLLTKLQHRNLVRLIGFCLEGNEKILIYEFVQNASLDRFIFDPVKCTNLDWERRYKIIGGIARGLLYLHEDACDRIIHRDLKASNILLDADMNPKISDFGMARLFNIDQTQDCTSRVVGT